MKLMNETVLSPGTVGEMRECGSNTHWRQGVGEGVGWTGEASDRAGVVCVCIATSPETWVTPFPSRTGFNSPSDRASSAAATVTFRSDCRRYWMLLKFLGVSLVVMGYVRSLIEPVWSSNEPCESLLEPSEARMNPFEACLESLKPRLWVYV